MHHGPSCKMPLRRCNRGPGIGLTLRLIMGVSARHLVVHVQEVARFKLTVQRPASVGSERLDAVVGIEEGLDELLNLTMNQIEDHRSRTVPVEQVLPIAVDAFALLVHDLVVVEQALADLVVSFFHLLLSGGNSAGDQI